MAIVMLVVPFLFLVRWFFYWHLYTNVTFPVEKKFITM